MNTGEQYQKFQGNPDYLLECLKKRDGQAFAFLFDCHGKSLYFYCNAILKSNDQAEDVVQESFISLWKMVSDLPTLLSIRAFLYKTARNASLDVLKHQQIVEKHKAALAIEWQEESLDAKMIEEELLGQLYQAIEKLPEGCAQVFRMSMTGMSNQEIADTLSISINTVKTQKQRAIQALRNLLGTSFSMVVMYYPGLFV